MRRKVNLLSGKHVKSSKKNDAANQNCEQNIDELLFLILNTKLYLEHIRLSKIQSQTF